MLTVLHFSTAFFALFFYPIHHIGLVHLQYFPYASSTDTAVVHFDRQFPGLFRVFVPFRVYGVIDAALLTFAALTSLYLSQSHTEAGSENTAHILM